jgi:hypothetical protein
MRSRTLRQSRVLALGAGAGMCMLVPGMRVLATSNAWTTVADTNRLALALSASARSRGAMWGSLSEQCGQDESCPTIRGGLVMLQGHRRRALAAGIAAAVAALTLSGGAARAASTSPHWRVVSSPNNSSTQRNYLEGVSCVSRSLCMGAGGYYNGANYQTLIEKWNGSTWSLVSSPNTTSTQGNYLEGVSCASSSFCMAAGDYYNGTNYQTLIEKWNGSTWSLVGSPNTSSTQDNYLRGVSCVSSSFCMAAGDYYACTNDQTLIEKWNGRTWSLVSSPNTRSTH